MDFWARMVIFRAERVVRRENRRRRKQLAGELAGYRTQAELDDLHALLDHYPDPQTQEIRQILHGQQQQRLRSAGGLG